MIAFIVILILSIIVALIMSKSIGLYRNVQRKLDKVLGKTGENLTGIRVIRAFSKERREIGEYDIATEDLYKDQVRVGNISALLNPLTYVVVNLGIVAILQAGGIQVNIGNLTTGQVVALINYMSQILVELVKFANLIILLAKASACAKRINEIFDIIREIHESGTTVLLVEQNAKKALSIADRAYVLETGNIVLDGDAKTLIDDDSVKKAYLGE